MTVASPHQSRVQDVLAAERLGTGSVLGYVLSSVAPLTVAAGLITVAFAVTGITAIPFTLGAVVLLLALFAIGFLRMARHVANAGAFYSYVARGLGRPAGVGAAVVALGAYNCLQVALYGMFGATAAGSLKQTLGWDKPWWFWALAAWAIVLVLGLLDVKWVSRLLAVFVLGETAVILALSIRGLSEPAADAGYVTALSPTGLTLATFAVGSAVAVLCFVGFEIAPVYREEAKRATRTIIAATALALGSMAVTYGLAAWAMIVHYGPGQVVATAQKLGPEMLFQLGGTGWLATAGRWLFLSSLFAAMMAFHNAVARYGFVLGRERVLPQAFDRVNSAQAPWVVSLTQSLIGLAVITLYAVKGWDPTVRLFFWLGQTGGFLVLGLLALTSIAIANFFRTHRDPVEHSMDRPATKKMLFPIIAALGLIWLFWQVWSNYSLLLGEQHPSLASRLLPASGVILLALGLARAAWLYVRKPDVYRRVGHHDEIGKPVMVPAPTPQPAAEF